MDPVRSTQPSRARKQAASGRVFDKHSSVQRKKRFVAFYSALRGAVYRRIVQLQSQEINLAEF
jgi:hypothetical protein